MWTDTTRKRHARKGPGLPSNLTDGEWEILEPFLPPASHVGRPRKWPMWRIVDAMLYLLRGRLPWRMLPPGFPPATTEHGYFYAWRDNEILWVLWQFVPRKTANFLSNSLLASTDAVADRSKRIDSSPKLARVDTSKLFINI